MLKCLRKGHVGERLYLLGDADVPVYLYQFDDRGWALFEGGAAAKSEMIWRQLNALVDPREVEYWFITHSHFDHCGALMALYSRLPNVSVVANQETAQHWQSQRALDVIARLNQEALESPIEFTPLDTIPVQIVRANDCIHLGNQSLLLVLATPGHATDQIAYYDKVNKRLFCADALGELHVKSMTWRPLMFSNVDDYRRTIRKLGQLEVQELIPGHGGVVCGREINTLMLEADKAAEQLIEEYQEHQRAGLSVEQLTTKLVRRWSANSASYISSFLHERSMRVMLLATDEYLKEHKYEQPVCDC